MLYRDSKENGEYIDIYLSSKNKKLSNIFLEISNWHISFHNYIKLYVSVQKYIFAIFLLFFFGFCLRIYTGENKFQTDG